MRPSAPKFKRVTTSCSADNHDDDQYLFIGFGGKHAPRY
jgi:hypothetical protein